MEKLRPPKYPPPLLNKLWEGLLAEHGTYWGKVISDSMRPLMREGDQVLVESTRQDAVHFGDIVVFERTGQLTVHRVIGKRVVGRQMNIIEKGDATLQPSLVPAVSIIGKVLVVRKSGGDIHVASRWGYAVQRLLACISRFSLGLWAPLENSTLYRYVLVSLHFRTTYSRFFSLIRMLVICLLPCRRQTESEA